MSSSLLNDFTKVAAFAATSNGNADALPGGDRHGAPGVGRGFSCSSTEGAFVEAARTPPTRAGVGGAAALPAAMQPLIAYLERKFAEQNAAIAGLYVLTF